jgi:hypothetical protein
LKPKRLVSTTREGDADIVIATEARHDVKQGAGQVLASISILKPH